MTPAIPNLMGQKSGRQLQTVETTINIVRALQELDGAGVTELSDHLDLSKASVHHHLSTLESNHIVVQKHGQYQLGLRFAAFGEYVKNQNPIYRAGWSEVDDLAKTTGEYVHLMTEQFGRAVHLYKAQGEMAVGTSYHRRNLQHRDYLHYSAAGKAILSCLPESQVKRIVETYGLPERTDRTITTEAALAEELKTVSADGYAVNDEEEIPGLRAVAAPVDPDEANPVGAVSISGPVSRMDDSRFEEEYPELVIQVANVIQLNIDTTNQQTT